MPPRGSKRQAEPTSGASVTKRKAEPTSGNGNIKVQLVEGEQDAQNLDFHSKVQAAWAILVTKWPDIENEPPPEDRRRGRAIAILSEGHGCSLANG